MDSDLISSEASRWQVIQRGLGQRLAQRLFDEISRRPIMLSEGEHPPMPPTLLLAYAMALSVYASGFALGAVGIAILVSPWKNLLVVVLAFIALLLCWLGRPRRAKPPYGLLARSDFPNLYTLADRIAGLMGSPAVDGIAVSADFGANYRRAGWVGGRYVEIGAPLVAILTAEERVALLAHELSHGANGDPLRGPFLFGAIDALSSWASAIRPDAIGRSGDGSMGGPILSIAALPLEFAMLGFSELLLLFAKGMLLLVLRQSQRAEYLADRLAASVAGTVAMQRALEKSYLFNTVDSAVQRHALAGGKEPLLPLLREIASGLSEEELERHRSHSRALHWQVDSTHPPTALRVDMLSLHGVPTAPQVIAGPLSDGVEREVERLVGMVQRELVNRKLAG